MILRSYKIFAGDRECEELMCHLPGACIDIIIALEHVNSKNQCITACKEEPLCDYWTYKDSTGQCSMYEDCPETDTTGCPSCVSGEKGCPIESGECKFFMICYFSVY